MSPIVSIVACVIGSSQPCESIVLDYQREDGSRPTLMECLGAGGQSLVIEWQKAHPSYRVAKYRCSIGVPRAKLEDVGA